MSGATLPPGFEDLEPFTRRWILPDFEARMLARHGADMEELQVFYDAAMPRFREMVAALDGHPLDTLPPPQLALYRLLMAFGHVAHSVERHGAPLPKGTRFPHTLRMVAGLTPA